MTPLQRATESSITPKSVMKTTVGGCAGCADRGLASERQMAAVMTNNKDWNPGDFPGEANVIRIKLNPPKRFPVY
jgi:hypothetical protein